MNITQKIFWTLGSLQSGVVSWWTPPGTQESISADQTKVFEQAYCRRTDKCRQQKKKVTQPLLFNFFNMNHLQ